LHFTGEKLRQPVANDLLVPAGWSFAVARPHHASVHTFIHKNKGCGAGAKNFQMMEPKLEPEREFWFPIPQPLVCAVWR